MFAKVKVNTYQFSLIEDVDGLTTSHVHPINNGIIVFSLGIHALYLVLHLWSSVCQHQITHLRTLFLNLLCVFFVAFSFFFVFLHIQLKRESESHDDENDENAAFNG